MRLFFYSLSLINSILISLPVVFSFGLSSILLYEYIERDISGFGAGDFFKWILDLLPPAMLLRETGVAIFLLLILLFLWTIGFMVFFLGVCFSTGRFSVMNILMYEIKDDLNLRRESFINHLLFIVGIVIISVPILALIIFNIVHLPWIIVIFELEPNLYNLYIIYGIYLGIFVIPLAFAKITRLIRGSKSG